MTTSPIFVFEYKKETGDTTGERGERGEMGGVVDEFEDDWWGVEDSRCQNFEN